MDRRIDSVISNPSLSMKIGFIINPFQLKVVRTCIEAWAGFCQHSPGADRWTCAMPPDGSSHLTQPLCISVSLYLSSRRLCAICPRWISWWWKWISLLTNSQWLYLNQVPWCGPMMFKGYDMTELGWSSLQSGDIFIVHTIHYSS